MARRRRRTIANARKEIASWPVSRVLSGGLRLRDGHSSGAPIARRLKQPTRVAGLMTDLAPRFHARPATPIWSCSRWGLPCHDRRRPRGALLPHPFTLTCGGPQAVCFLWHFPWGRPRRPLAATVSPWSPDFPPPELLDGPQTPAIRQRPSGQLAPPNKGPGAFNVKRYMS